MGHKASASSVEATRGETPGTPQSVMAQIPLGTCGEPWGRGSKQVIHSAKTILPNR